MCLLENVRKTIDNHKLLTKGDKVLVSVSGGPDSLALLHILHRLQQDYDLSLYVFHLDHMFRGEESKADAEYVKLFAERLEIPVNIREYDVPTYIKENNLSKQAAAREIRYQLCVELANDIGADKIALGQHADDQAETVMINFLRGAGLEGLSGINPIRDNRFIRPLLEVWRKDIDNYCEEYNLQPRLDSSNFKPVYLRNKIRLELLPYLEDEFNEGIKENLNRMAEIIRVENDFLESYVVKEYKRILANESQNKLSLYLESLRDLDLAIQRRVFRKAISSFCGTKKDYYFHHIQQIEELINVGETGSIIQLPQGLRVKRGYEKLIFFWQETQPRTKSISQIYSIPGKYQIKELGIEVILKIIIAGPNWRQVIREEDKLYINKDRIGNRIKIRNRKDGDRFRPLGMQGSKKIKDFMIDEKIPVELRDRMPIFTTLDDEIFAIDDLRVDNRFRITDETKEILTVQVNRI